MTDLIPGSEFDEIRNAINDVTDTFHKFIITYRQHGQQFDRWSEENAPQQIVDTDLKCLVEFIDDDETDMSQQGVKDVQTLQVSFSIDYLDSVNMMDATSKEAKFDKGKDYFIYEGALYRLAAMWADGPINTKNALIVITLNKEEKTGGEAPIPAAVCPPAVITNSNGVDTFEVVSGGTGACDLAVFELILKPHFKATEDTSEVEIDGDSAGILTGLTDDGASGDITVSYDGSPLDDFSTYNPLTTVAGKVLQIKRTVTTNKGFGRFTGTY